MNDRSQGYAAGVPYAYGYYRQLSPALLRTALLARGVAHATDPHRFRYCELGCGRGLTSNILAATHPQAEFWSVDFDPSHIADARELARDAGLDNVLFFDASFEKFAEQDLPEFDFMVMHGVYSWVSPENRQVLLRLVDRLLKPGGVVYVSYNALPGWSRLQPLSRLLFEGVEHGKGTVLERMSGALALADALRRNGTGYFGGNAEAGAELDKLLGKDFSYLVHEFHNRDWTALYHADMAQAMGSARCQFAAPADLLDHVDGFNLGAADLQTLRSVEDSAHAETVRDFMVNRRFRRDVFVKGVRKFAPAQAWDAWQGLRLVLTAPRSSLRLEVAGRLGTARLDPAIYAPLLDGLAGGALTVAELRRKLPALASLPPASLIEALLVMLGAGHLEACPAPDETGARSAAVLRLNSAILQRARSSGEILCLASPVTGGGVPLARTSQLFLLAEAEGVADRVSFAAERLAVQGTRLLKEGMAIEGAGAVLEELHRREAQFRQETRLQLQMLGVAGAPRPAH